MVLKLNGEVIACYASEYQAKARALAGYRAMLAVANEDEPAMAMAA
jgi:hypothetical protein